MDNTSLRYGDKLGYKMKQGAWAVDRTRHVLDVT